VADLVHVKGLGLALLWAMASAMAFSSSATLANAPLRMRCAVMTLNHRSTRLSQDDEVGITWKWKRGWRSSQSLTSCFLWVA
jgi:hypothetical protein